MAWLQKSLVVVMVVTWGVSQGSPLLTGQPFKDILDNPDFRPKPETPPNKTIDQVITEAYGGLPMYMSENFLDLDGGITTELDMVLTPEQYKSMYMKTNDRSKRKATRPLVYRWTNKTIPYEFITSHFNVEEVYYIKAAMEKWQETTCVKFRPATSADKNRIRFQNGNGCNSLLGMYGQGVQPINLQAPGCRYTGLYLHEIGHAIGLVHEHQLPDRDQYIYIIYDNVAPSMRVWFNKYSTKEVNQYGVPFEYSSVMHYGITAFSKDGSSQTIRARDPSKEKEIGRVYLKGLAFSDIKVVNLMYNCNAHCAVDRNCKDPGYLDKNCKCVRPDDGSTTTTTTTKPGECSNNWDNRQCEGWARDGECRNNPVWMKDNCKKSCKACKDTGDKKPDSKKCENIHGDWKCEEWAKIGECDANAVWMRKNCKKACKACKSTETTSVDCRDNHQYCAAWAKSGYCFSNMYTKENCKKSCKTCSTIDGSENDISEKTKGEEENKPNGGMTVTMSWLMTASVVIRIINNYL